MSRFVTGLFRPNVKKQMGFMTTMFCPDHKCGYLWKASRTSNPCPKCGNKNVIPAANWAPAMPGLEMGKVNFYKPPVPEKGDANGK